MTAINTATTSSVMGMANQMPLAPANHWKQVDENALMTAPRLMDTTKAVEGFIMA